MAKPSFPQWLVDEAEEYPITSDRPQIVLDIGANVGAFTHRCLKLWPECFVHAYEPVLENFDYLAAHIPQADACRVRLYNAAVLDFNGEAVITLGDNCATHGFVDLGRSTKMREEVACIDARNLPAAELVKIDTEGSEITIIRRLDLDNYRAVVCEYHRLADLREMLRYFAERGWKRTDWITQHLEMGLIRFSRDT